MLYVEIVKTAPRATNIHLRDMTPGQVKAFKRALKLYAEDSIVCEQVLEAVENGEEQHTRKEY